MSPDSCIFPYMEKNENNLKYLFFVISSNIWCSTKCLFSQQKPHIYSYSSLPFWSSSSELLRCWLLRYSSQFSQFSHSVVSDSLRPHGLQHTRLPRPSPTPGAYSNSCPSNQWCHPTISSSVSPVSSCLQSFPASGSFPVSQFFTSDGQSIGVSASASVLPMNTQDWSPLGWTGWISLQSKGLSRVFSHTSVQKHQFFGARFSKENQLSHPYMTTGKTIALTRWTFVGKVMSLLFNTLSRLVIVFLLRSKRLLVSWLQSPSAVILELKKNSLSLFPLFPCLFDMK